MIAFWSAGEKVLIFSNYLNTIAMLQKVIQQRFNKEPQRKNNGPEPEDLKKSWCFKMELHHI